MGNAHLMAWAVILSWIGCWIKLVTFGDLFYLLPLGTCLYLIILLDMEQKRYMELMIEIDNYSKGKPKTDAVTQTENATTKNNSTQTLETISEDKQTQTTLPIEMKIDSSTQTENAITIDQDMQTENAITIDQFTQTNEIKMRNKRTQTYPKRGKKADAFTQTTIWMNKSNKNIQTNTPFKLKMILYPEPFQQRKHDRMRRKLQMFKQRFNLSTIEEVDEELENESSIPLTLPSDFSEQQKPDNLDNQTNTTEKPSEPSLNDNMNYVTHDEASIQTSENQAQMEVDEESSNPQSLPSDQHKPDNLDNQTNTTEKPSEPSLNENLDYVTHDQSSIRTPGDQSSLKANQDQLSIPNNLDQTEMEVDEKQQDDLGKKQNEKRSSFFSKKYRKLKRFLKK